MSITNDCSLLVNDAPSHNRGEIGSAVLKTILFSLGSYKHEQDDMTSKHILQSAISIAIDRSVNTGTIHRAISHLQKELDSAALGGNPIPLDTYRAKRILEATTRVRQRLL